MFKIQKNILDGVSISGDLRFRKGEFWHFLNIFGEKVDSKKDYQQRALLNLKSNAYNMIIEKKSKKQMTREILDFLSKMFKI